MDVLDDIGEDPKVRRRDEYLVAGLGIGPTFAVFTLIVQNAVQPAVIGVATEALNRYAVSTQPTELSDVWRELWICGRAGTTNDCRSA